MKLKYPKQPTVVGITRDITGTIIEKVMVEVSDDLYYCTAASCQLSTSYDAATGRLTVSTTNPCAVIDIDKVIHVYEQREGVHER